MTAHAITAEVRTGTEKTSQIRSSKRVPGVVYGKTLLREKEQSSKK